MQAQKTELDIMVLEFLCADDRKFSVMGKQTKEMVWKVAALGVPAVEITCNFMKMPMMAPEISILADGKTVFPAGGEKGKLSNDFCQKWSFKGQAANLDKRDYWEVRPKAMGDNWFPATSLNQRRDGVFEAVVWLPDVSGGVKQIVLPEVDREDIREVRTKAQIDVPVRTVFLRIAYSDPMSETTFTLLNGVEEEPLTYNFARPTPAPAPSSMESAPSSKAIQMELSRDRKALSTNVSHELLSSYMATDARAVSFSSEAKTKACWKIMLGPYAEHTISIEKKATGAGAQILSGSAGLLGGMKQVTEMAETGLLQQSDIVSLVVDGKVLVEGSPDDFDADWETAECPNVAGESEWLCRFRFAGERSVMCKVFETNEQGTTLDTTDLVESLREDQRPISKVCTVAIRELADLSTASLDIDGVLFGNLREFAPLEGAAIACDPEVLAMQYGIQAPTKVRDIAPLGIIQEKLQAGGAILADKLKEHWEVSQPVLKDQWEQAQGALGRLQEGVGQWFKKDG